MSKLLSLGINLSEVILNVKESFFQEYTDNQVLSMKYFNHYISHPGDQSAVGK